MDPIERLGWSVCADRLPPEARASAVRRLEASLVELRAGSNDRLLAHVLMCLAVHHHFRGDAGQPRALLDEALALEGWERWPDTRLALLQMEGIHWMHGGDPARACEAFLLMLRSSTEVGRRSFAIKAQLNLAYLASATGDRAGAQALVASARALADETGEERRLGEVLAAELVLGIESGDEPTATGARAALDDLIGLGADLDGRVLALHSLAGAVLDLARGDVDAAEAAARASLDNPHTQIADDRGLALTVLAGVALKRGDGEGALRQVDDARVLLADSIHAPRATLARSARCQALVALGRADELVEMVDEAAEFFPARLAGPVGEGLRRSIALALEHGNNRHAQDLRTNNDALRRLHHREVQARNAAESAALARHRFLSSMSHEIRTPMTGVMATVELLARSTLDARQSELVGVLRRSARLTLRILDDVLDLGKIESGRLSLDWQPFTLLQPVEDVLRMLVPRAEAEGVALWLEQAEDLPLQVRGDSRRIEQVLLNLVSNAIKFAGNGVVRVRVQRSADQTGIRIEVIDDGIGIPKAVQERLFDVYSQASLRTGRVYGGTGLGLAICKGLVTMYGGAIGVESAAGAGATFWVELPLPEVTAPPPPIHELTEARLDGLRILLAEDNDVNRALGRMMLEQLGATVEVAEDGVEAVRIGAAQPLDMVLMDMHMPRMDGLEATRHLRAGGFTGSIVALTAAALPEDREAARDAGMDGFATKPVQLDRLVQVILGVLARPS